jgi:single-strand DNA-binding protein
MSGLNKVMIIGRLGKDPEVRYTQDGAAVANFSIATSESWKDKESGQKMEKTEWHNIVVWKRLAEICGEFLKKGKEVYIEGKLQTSSWEKDGVKRYKTEIHATYMQMLGSRDDSNPKPVDDGEPIPF